ncbi:hypothetical protein DCM91_19305 [Chitinophaga costaii]|nr:hypothetical protein DCM91_19305 [Chitinophaga costaii]
MLFALVLLIALKMVHSVQRQDLNEIMNRHGYIVQDMHDTPQNFRYPGRPDGRQVSLRELIFLRPLNDIPSFKEIIFADRQGTPVTCLAVFAKERYGPLRIYFNIDLETLRPLEEAA